MIREIVRPQNRQVKIEIPQQYVNKQLEILILPFYEMEDISDSEHLPNDEKLQLLFKNAPNIKIDNNIDIDALMNKVNDVVL